MLLIKVIYKYDQICRIDVHIWYKSSKIIDELQKLFFIRLSRMSKEREIPSTPASSLDKQKKNGRTISQQSIKTLEYKAGCSSHLLVQILFPLIKGKQSLKKRQGYLDSKKALEDLKMMLQKALSCQTTNHIPFLQDIMGRLLKSKSEVLVSNLNQYLLPLVQRVAKKSRCSQHNWWDLEKYGDQGSEQQNKKSVEQNLEGIVGKQMQEKNQDCLTM